MDELTQERYEPIAQPGPGIRKAVLAALAGLYLVDGRWRTRGLGAIPQCVAAADLRRAEREGWVRFSADGTECTATREARRWVAG